MRPEVDRAVCAGYGECAKLAPDVFVLDDDDISSVRAGAAIDDATAQLAVAGCPMQAIGLVEE